MTPHRPDAEDTPHRRRTDTGWPANASTLYTLLLITTFIFTSGVSYRKLAETSDTLAIFAQEVRTNYVRRDVQSEQLQRLQSEIEMLRTEVRDLSDALDRATATRTPGTGGPRFERK